MTELDAEARAAIAAILIKHFPDAMLDPVAPHELDIYRAGLERAAKILETHDRWEKYTLDGRHDMHGREVYIAAIRALMGP